MAVDWCVITLEQPSFHTVCANSCSLYAKEVLTVINNADSMNRLMLIVPILSLYGFYIHLF